LDRKLFDGELLLTGASMNGHRDVVDAIRDLKLTHNVRWLGHLPQQDIPHLYNLARLMVFPSLYEGFGLPVVEAMASGCPVVCSQQGALPDVGGAAVEYCNPLLVEDIADKMALVWSNDAVRERCRRNGLEQAGLFRWENTARNTIDVYRSAVAVT
jgi:glycosyltransferase involved in cell wall biosynthesis